MIKAVVGLLLAGLVSAGYASPQVVPYSYHGSSATVINGSNIVIVNGQVVSGQTGAAEGKGPSKTEPRALAAYSSVELKGPVTFAYAVAPTVSFRVEAPANLLPLIATTVSGARLTVSLREPVTLSQPIRIEARGPSLEALSITGSGDIQARGLSGRALRIQVAGSGNVAASGTVQQVEVRVAGSGAVDLTAVKAAEVDVTVSGSGDVAAYAAKRARIVLSGSGAVSVSGNPPQRSVDTSGSGRVRFVGH